LTAEQNLGIDFQETVSALLQEQSASRYKAFLRTVRVVRLDLPDLERHLNCLERATFITTEEKCKQLFLYACEQNLAEIGKQYLALARSDSYALLIDLLAQDDPPANAICELCKGGIDLRSDDAHISNLLLLLELGVSPNNITLNKTAAPLWAFGTKNPHLIGQVCSRRPHLTPVYATHCLILAYFRDVLKPTDILCKLYEMGFSPTAHFVELLKYAARHDDVMLAELLLKENPYSLNQYQKLFFELIRLQAWKLLQSMMSKGFDLHLSIEGQPSPFARLVALKMYDVIRFLIAHSYLHPNTYAEDGLPLIFWAIENGSADLFDALTSKGVNLFVTTKDKETLLHRAVKKEALSCVRSLLQKGVKLQVNVLDIHKRPPLYYAFSPLKLEIALELLKAGALPFHLGDRLVEYCHFVETQKCLSVVIGSHKLYQQFSQLSQPTLTFSQFLNKSAPEHPFEVLEIKFLIPTLENQLQRYTRKEDYLNDLLLLQKKYQPVPEEYFYPFLINLITGHLSRRAQEFTIPPIQAPVDIKLLLTHFDNLNWTRPEEPFYCDPENVKVMGTTEKRDALRSSLRALVETYVPERTVFPGTPPRGPALDLFYTNLETVLKHITLMLETEREPHFRKKALLKLAWSTIKCGTRWEEIGLRVYKLLKFKKKEEQLWEDAFDDELANLREILARNIGRNGVHGYRQVVRVIGKQFAIPMSDGIANVPEPYERSIFTPEYCGFFFLKCYRANLVIPRALDFFKASFQKNDGAIIKWFSNNLPEDFIAEGQDELSWACSAISLFYTTYDDQKAALQRLFNKRGVYISPGEIPADLNPQALIKRYRASEYVSQHLYNIDTGEILLDGLIHFLKARSIAQEVFPGIFVEFLAACKRN